MSIRWRARDWSAANIVWWTLISHWSWARKYVRPALIGRITKHLKKNYKFLPTLRCHYWLKTGRLARRMPLSILKSTEFSTGLRFNSKTSTRNFCVSILAPTIHKYSLNTLSHAYLLCTRLNEARGALHWNTDKKRIHFWLPISCCQSMHETCTRASNIETCIRLGFAKCSNAICIIL